MAIKASSSTLIDRLIADLTEGPTASREAAVARLTLIGPRAVERLATLAASTEASTPARAAALRALEAIADPRALKPALAILSDARIDAALGAAAAGVAGVFVRGTSGTAAVDRLTAAALDRTRPEGVRLVALRALRDLKPSTIAPLLASLASDPSAAIRAEVAPRRKANRAAVDPLALIANAATQGLVDAAVDAAALRRALSEAGESVPLPDLQRLVERIRERESAEPESHRDEWTAARAAAHLALAERGSRLALYDLRESLQTGAALPAGFMAALAMVGDASTLEAIAAAYAKTKQAAWRDQLATAFRAIVSREKLTRRHAAVKNIEKKWKGAVDQLWSGRSTGRVR